MTLKRVELKSFSSVWYHHFIRVMNLILILAPCVYRSRTRACACCAASCAIQHAVRSRAALCSRGAVPVATPPVTFSDAPSVSCAGMPSCAGRVPRARQRGCRYRTASHGGQRAGHSSQNSKEYCSTHLRCGAKLFCTGRVSVGRSTPEDLQRAGRAQEASSPKLAVQQAAA